MNRANSARRRAATLLLAVAILGRAAAQESPTLEQALAAKTDVWGEASVRDPDGPSFESFAKLLPPLRYVNAAFRDYPIVLSKPGGLVKARVISNGSGVNPRGRLDTWRDPSESPIAFELAPARTLEQSGASGDESRWEPFGADLARLEGPTLDDGWRPILRWRYKLANSVIFEEAFASVAPRFEREDAVVFVRFRVESGGAPARIAARVDGGGMHASGGLVRDLTGRAFAWYDPAWQWDEAGQRLVVEPGMAGEAGLAIFTRGCAADGPAPAQVFGAPIYEEELANCREAWQGRLDAALKLETAEPRVNDAWRALVAGTFLLAQDDQLDYSAGNLYECTFEAECGDAAHALALYGVPGAARLVAPLLARPLQRGLETWDVAFKLQLLAQHWFLARDARLAARHADIVWPEVERALAQLDAKTGLLPPSDYCGDISRKVVNLATNASFWRGLRDASVVLEEIGEKSRAAPLADAAAKLRPSICSAASASIDRETKPPFVPMALFGAEKPYDLLTATKEGSYWNLIAPYVAASGVFGPAAPEPGWILDWQRDHGGLCMGMVRFHQHSGLFANEDGVDDLYTLRRVQELLRRDEPEQALVAFYGKLAQGMTRDTFVGCEGSSLVPLDPNGRPMYLPPNASANAFFLTTLRELLVQETDEDDDGRPDSLRLLFATPRRWLADGATLTLERAPTAFGRISVRALSLLKGGLVTVDVAAPPRAPRSMRLRLRLPAGASIASARIGATALSVDSEGTIDLTGRTGSFTIQAGVRVH